MSMFRFLPGILVVEAATVGVVMTAKSGSGEADWVPLGLLAFIITLLIAVWFGSIADHVKKDALAEARNSFARERENLLVAAETDKRATLEETHRRLVREVSRANRRANIKLGFGLFVLLSIGAVLLAVELVTVGLLTFAAAGGAVAGYLVRSRQEALAYQRKTGQGVPPQLDRVIEVKPEKPPSRRLVRQRRRDERNGES
jgi:Flp pilus assembly protein TadB